MSHYSQIQTKIRDLECLKKALADVGWGPEKVEVGNGLHLYGYHGDRRAETADVVVRRRHINSSSNDLGFRREADGTYSAIVSDWDQSNGVAWKTRGPKIQQRYAYHMAMKAAQAYIARGYKVTTQTAPNGAIRVVIAGGR